MPTTCPSHDDLQAYSVGLLSDEASDTIAAHVASCPDCRANLSTFDGMEDTLLKQLRRPAVADPFLEESQCQVAVARACNVPDAPHAGRANRSLSGKTLGEYQLISELGQGGMGTVYKALQMKLDRVVALKVLSRSGAADGPAISRFEREMRAVGKISHPNVVQAYDAREIDGMPVLIMEFIDGLDMAQIVRRTGPLTVADACEVVRRTALGLQQAHEHGLVHRDIKPSNIMLTRAGEVKLLDLGLARFYAESAAGEEMTGTGQAMGTADYMAPEQASDCRTVDIRADLYSLGCTLYKLLSGRAPFRGAKYASALDKMNAHVREPVPPIRQFAPHVPDALAAQLDRLLAKCPAERFATPADVVAALEPFCDGANLAALVARAAAEDSFSTSEREQQVVTPSPAPVRRRRRPILRTILIGLAFLGSLAAAFAAGILITIKKGDQTYQVEVPDNSQVTIDEKGNATVKFTDLPSSPGTAEASAGPRWNASPPGLPDEKEIQGTWQVVSSSFRLLRKMQPFAELPDQEILKASQVVITADTFKILGPHVTTLAFRYKLNPAATPKMIDLQIGGTFGLVSYGIYELDGNQLRICASELHSLDYGTSPPDDKTLRPATLWTPFGSKLELLVLRRISDATVSEDEKSIRGTWKVDASSDEWPDLGFSRNQVLKFSRDECIRSAEFGGPEVLRLAYALNPATKPKRLDFATLSAPDMEPIHGAYELKGDRLTIAWKAGILTERQPPAPPRKVAAGAATRVVVLKRVAETSEQPPKSQRKGESKGPPVRAGPWMGQMKTMPGTTLPSPAGGPPEVNVVRPVVRQVTPHEDLTGRLEAAQTAEIRSRVTGHLARVLFKPGATVKQGDLLFELDPAPLQAELDKRQADVRLAQLRVKRTTAALKDAQKPSPSERQRLEAEQAEAEAALTAAQEGLRVAQINLESTRLTAPITGRIGRPLVSAGSLVTNTTTLAAIDSVDPIGVAFCVPQNTVLSLCRSPADRKQESATTVFIRLSDETSFAREGKVESADTRIDPATGTAAWRATLPNPDGLLMPGMAVGVRLITGAPYQAILVPETAVRAEAGKQFVCTVTDQNIVQRRTVKVGDRDDRMRVVKEGLTADDWVIPESLPAMSGNVFGGMTPGSMMGGGLPGMGPPQWQDGMAVKPRKTPPPAPQPSSKVKKLPPSGTPSKK